VWGVGKEVPLVFDLNHATAFLSSNYFLLSCSELTRVEDRRQGAFQDRRRRRE